MTMSDLWSANLLPLLSLSVKFPDGRIRLYCKGADTVIYERLSPNSRHKESTQTALDVSLHGFLLICTDVFSLSWHGWYAVCRIDVCSFLSWFCARKQSVYCTLGICQCDLADAVLVLQRHQHRRVRSLVQEPRRSPGGHGRQRRCPWPRVWADREQPDGGWEKKKILYSCTTWLKFPLGNWSTQHWCTGFSRKTGKSRRTKLKCGIDCS